MYYINSIAYYTANCFVKRLTEGHVTVPSYLVCVWHNTVLALGRNSLSFIEYLLAQLQFKSGCTWGM